MTEKQLKELVGPDTFLIMYILWSRGQSHLAGHVFRLHATAHKFSNENTRKILEISKETFGLSGTPNYFG